MATPDRMQLLTNALRAAASRAAELAGGGAALLFAAMPGDAGGESRSRLRAAAGFASLDEARNAAASLATSVGQCIGRGQMTTTAPIDAMGERGSAGVVLLPLESEDHVHGAIVVGMPAQLDAQATSGLGLLAASTAIQIHYYQLYDEVQGLRAATDQSEAATGEHGDELLKLSETLFAQDIELLRSNEKLGQIEKIKSDFIEKMSRELRTPLNSIIEATISVLAGENETLSDGAKASLRQALDEGTTYQRTLQSILDIWRIRQGEMPVEIQDLNFSEVIDEAIFSVQDTLQGKPVTISKLIAAPLPKIKSDLAKVNQILFLLLDNAAKFTAEGNIEISAEVSDGMLRCSVADTGIGICPDDQQYVFDEFFQVDDRATNRYRGAGLGLSLVRELLVLLDGECKLRSEAGRGTTATVAIPIQVV